MGLGKEILSAVLKKSGQAAGKALGLRRIVEPRKQAWRRPCGRLSWLWSQQPLQEVPTVPRENRGPVKKGPEGEGRELSLGCSRQPWTAYGAVPARELRP